MRIRPVLLLSLVAVLFGCQTSTLPNPNAPEDVGPLSADNMKDQLGSISDSLQIHVWHQEITDKEYRELMQQAAEGLLKGYTADRIEPAKAWKYAEVLVTAHRWPDAKVALEIAVEWAKRNHNEDRRVNDSLHLARVLSELGQVEEAIKLARTVFDVRPVDGAPILYGVLDEIVPAGRGKGKDLELARLVEDAIAITQRVQVDPSSQSGQLFLRYRPERIRRGWFTAALLYDHSKRPDLADKARANAHAIGRGYVPEQRVKV